MKFSEAKKEQLLLKLQDIFLKCALEAKEKGEEALMDWYFLEKVYYANLVTDPKQYFLLGALAEQAYNGMLEALPATMKMMGLIQDDSKLSKAQAYWNDKYGKERATVLCEKLFTAFRGEKYSLEQIKSMGDKIALFNSWEHA